MMMKTRNLPLHLWLKKTYILLLLFSRNKIVCHIDILIIVKGGGGGERICLGIMVALILIDFCRIDCGWTNDWSW
jgi:hypothetical protein